MLLARVLARVVQVVCRRPQSAPPPSIAVCRLLSSNQFDAALGLAKAEAQFLSDQDWDAIADIAAEGQESACEELLLLGLRQCSGRMSILYCYGKWLAARFPLRAASCFVEVRRGNPKLASADRELGSIHLKLGNIHSAIESCLAAISKDESDPKTWDLLGRCHERLGNKPAANSAYARAIALASGNSEFAEASGVDLADSTLDAGLRVATSSAPMYLRQLELASQLEQQGDQEAAGAILRQAATAAPSEPSVRLAQGEHFARQGRWRSASKALEKAYRLSPDNIEISIQVAIARYALGAYGKAEGLVSRMLAAGSTDPRLLALAGDCASVLGNGDLAIRFYRQALSDSTDRNPKVLNNYGCALTLLERFTESVAPLEEAIRRDPTLLKAHINLAYALTYLGRLSEAESLLEAVLAIQPHDFDARWYRSHLLLATHRYVEGWHDYRYRFVVASTPVRIPPIPLWDGSSLTGKTILVVPEQGIGDEIMFSSCLDDLIAIGGRVILECDHRLYQLFSRSFPRALVTSGPSEPSAPYPLEQQSDYHISAGSLPEYFRTSPDAFLRSPPFLVASAQKVARFRSKLAALGPGLKVGIAWRGGTAGSRSKSRSVNLPNWHPILKSAGCHFVSLQYGNVLAEIDQASLQGIAIHHWPEAIADLDEFAALVDALDLVISVCSAPVHFAGGLGRRAWVLTPHAPEWRYSEFSGAMIWYPSVRLFHQATPGDWTAVIDRIAIELLKLTSPGQE